MDSFRLETLEERRLLAWGTYPQLIQQDQAVANYPSITGAGVNIALIDSGVDFSQPNLAGKFWTNPGEIAGNGKDDDGDGYVDDTKGWDFYNNDNNPEDQNGHGTAMSGIIAGSSFTSGGATYAGIAQGAKIIPLKVADPTGGYSLAFAQRVEKALQWVEKNYQKYNISIVSMSIRTPLADYNATYADEVSRLIADGLFIAAAGGQEDANSDVEYPGRANGVFAVSVVEPNDTFPTDSVNRGPGIDLLAPGDGVPILLRGGGNTTSAQATSYATPFASATAALLKQADPTLTAAEITTILKNTGSNVTDTSTGFAFSGRTYKRLNVFQAVKNAVDNAPVADVKRPTAVASAANVTASGATSYSFTVTYSDNVAVKASTIDGNDILVTGPNGFSQSATLVSINTSGDGTPRTATYRITPPGGSWNSADNGAYTLTVVGGQVTDTSGNNISSAALATFNVTLVNTSTGTISGVVYNDADADGAKSKAEKKAIAAVLFLDLNNNGTRESNEPLTSSSPRSGNYAFVNVAPGTYNVRQIAPTGWRQTLPSRFYTATVVGGQAVTGLTFGDTLLNLFSGTVFNDLNASGTQTSGEAGLAGWQVFVDFNGDGKHQKREPAVLTDSAGGFAFNTLAAGSYVVRIGLQAGWSRTTSKALAVTFATGEVSKGNVFGLKQI
ncbi:MAG: peptidase and in kexin sedolisin [Phycisphaerales bacterium]|nr:peptidase and in kexin sedolisin [Phycisphaerales bacterium]